MTSVKEFRVADPATATDLGRGSFVFTDDYSVFDWGKMPDTVPNKGASLCAMGAYNFAALEDAGVPTHYRGVVDDGDVVPLADASDAPWEMAIDLTQVPDLPREGRTYDYDAYHDAAGENYLVPLEVVFRNRVPIGSSLRRRTDPGDHGLAHDEWPDEVVDLADPVVEFSTKYEESDRYLDRAAADRIAGLADVDALADLARTVNRVVTDRAAAADLVHEDGKIEVLYHDGQLKVADVVGTFDENRFSYEGTQLSKEVLRQYHKRSQPEWVEAVRRAKTAAEKRDVADWKGLCERDPEPLDEDVLRVAGEMYAAGANAYLGRGLFDAPSLETAIGAVRGL